MEPITALSLKLFEHVLKENKAVVSCYLLMAVICVLYAFAVLPALAVYIAAVVPATLFMKAAIDLGNTLAAAYEESKSSDV